MCFVKRAYPPPIPKRIGSGLALKIDKFGIVGEIAGQSEDDVQPKGVFALGALTYKADKHVQFDVGARFGLNPAAPRVGIFAGVVVGIADFFKKR